MKHLKVYENFDDEVRISDTNRDEFVTYFLDFYGPDGMWKNPLNNKINKKIVLKYVDKFIRTRTRLQMWGKGDSFDIEYFRDVLFVKLGIDYDTEYDVSQYLTAEERRKVELEKNTKKYNL